MIFFVNLRKRDGPATRLTIKTTIEGNPGIRKMEICRKCKLSWGTVSHHVKHLLRDGEVARAEVGGLRPANVPSRQVMILRLLREEVPLKIVEELARTPGLGSQALATRLGPSRKVIRRHLMDLERTAIVRKSDDYHPKYELVPGAARLLQAVPPSDLGSSLGDAPGGPSSPF